MPSPRYKGLRIHVSYSAMQELCKYEKTLFDIVNIVEKGYDAPRKRKTGTMEKWFDKGKKTYNVVLSKDYNEILAEECWVLIHFGRFTRRKK
jgi:hypothetical protein